MRAGKRPWICDRLSVDVRELFEVFGDDSGAYIIDKQGCVWERLPNKNDQQIHMEGWLLAQIMENPDMVERVEPT